MQCRRVWLVLLLVSALPVCAIEPIALTTLSTGDLAILNTTQGIEKLSASNVRTRLVSSFGIYQAGGFVALPATGGDAFLVTQQMYTKMGASFPRLGRYEPSGRRTTEWPLMQGGGALAGIAVHPNGRIVYCSDSRTNSIYQLDLQNPKAGYVVLAKARDAGILGPIVVDARRGRLLVADVQEGTILAVPLSGGNVEVVVPQGSVSEPVAMALDPATDRLYIADSARARIWTGTPNGTKWTLATFTTSQKLKLPTTLTLARDGSLWVFDREQRLIWLFARDGKTLRTVKP